jgi:hypothetical protein
VSSKKDFLKRTMTDKNFIHNYGKVVSASPYRAVVRRMDYSSMIDDGSDEGSPNQFNPEGDDFNERDEESKSMF